MTFTEKAKMTEAKYRAEAFNAGALKEIADWAQYGAQADLMEADRRVFENLHNAIDQILAMQQREVA